MLTMKTNSLLLLLVAPLLANGFTPIHQATTTTSTACTQKTASVFDTVQQTGLALTFSAMMLLSTMNPAFAADFAGQDISGQDFSGQDLSGKDFTKVIAKGTKFGKANLQGASFQQANLIKADFSGADLQNAKFEDAILDGSIFKDVTAQRAVFSSSILDIADLENADLSDSLWPSRYRIMICDMDELKGINKATGVDTRESLLCTDYTRSS